VASADDYQLLVGSYTAGQSQGIYRLNFDSTTGQINGKPLQVINSEKPVLADPVQGSAPVVRG